MVEPAQTPGTVTLASDGDITIGGDVVGRDKIVTTIRQFYERALTAAEAAAQAHTLERQHLAQGIRDYVARLRVHASEPAQASHPYRGLLEYHLGDAELFFGRSRAVGELLRAAVSARLTVLHAESGTGKTSLLQAGVAPQLLAAAQLPLILRPYNQDPGLVIKRALVPDLSAMPSLARASLADFLRAVSDVLGSGTTLYILLDQFEEFFTQLADAERQLFIDELANCLDDQSLSVRWLLSLRTEYFGSMATFRPRIRQPFANDYQLQRLTRAEAHVAIAEPARQRGLQFEDGLVEQLLDDLGGDALVPPQLQLVCSALAEELQPGETTITHASYTREGGTTGILRGHLERVLSRDLRAPYRSVARRLLEALIDADRHRVVRTGAELERELASRHIAADDVSATIAQLVDSRLVKITESERGLAYEIAHDYLLDEIRMDPEVQARKAIQELLDQEVRAFERFNIVLTAERLALITPYRPELQLSETAEQLLLASQSAAERQQAEAEAMQQRELRALRKLARMQDTQQQSRWTPRMWIFWPLLATSVIGTAAFFTAVMPELIASSFFFAIIVLFIGYATSPGVTQRTDAEFSPDGAMLLTINGRIQLWDTRGKDIAELAPGSIDSAAFRPDGAAVLLVAGPTATVCDLQGRLLMILKLPEPISKRSAFAASGVFSPDGQTILTTLLPGHSQIWNASGTLRAALSGSTGGIFSPNGNVILTIAAGNSARLWTSEGHILATLEGHTRPVQALAFSPDSARFATASADHTARIWNLEGELIAELKGHTAALTAIEFDLAGQQILTASADGTARIWDCTGAQLALLDEHTKSVCSAHYSPDGQAIVTASEDGMAILWSSAGQFRVDLGPRSVFRRISSARFSPDGQRIVIVEDQRTYLVDRAGQIIAWVFTTPTPTAGGSPGI